MKKLLVIVAAALTFAACGNKNEKTLGTETTTTPATTQPVVVKREVRYVNTTPAAPVEQPKKKGWSKAATGTAIGAGAGAIIGAGVGKGKGAIIGGVIGAGTGYVIGRSADKKDGRVKK